MAVHLKPSGELTVTPVLNMTCYTNIDYYVLVSATATDADNKLTLP